jgi:exonuclease III
MPQISFAAQNCNSLNISTCCEKQLKKIVAITCLNACIIFLSDIRLGNNKSVDDISTAFRFNDNCNYDFFYNSTRNRRGVGILIKKNLNYTVHHLYKDDNENIITMIISVDDSRIKIISVYGPNGNDPNFFRDLRGHLELEPDLPTVAGGDWNTTLSADDTRFNIDILNMAAPPSLFRSRHLINLCDEMELTDPFRALHPGARDFTYIPRTGNNNRSRLDFFLISNLLVPKVSNCSINANLTTKLFDHKAVMLNFDKKNNNNKNQSINMSTINHSRFNAVITATVVETYLQHADADPDQGSLRNIGRCLELIRHLNNIEMDCATNRSDVIRQNIILTFEAELDALISHLPVPEELNNIELVPDPDIFFEVLTGNIMNALTSFQAWLNKIKSSKRCHIAKQLEELKLNFLNNENLILRLESELNSLAEADLRAKVENLKIFENLNSEKPTPLFLSLCKNRNNESLGKIRSPEGDNFGSDQERYDYITNEFENLFKNRTQRVLDDNAINDFLGPEIVNSDIVRNSMLTDQEKTVLDSPITLAEFDIAVKKGKIRSAPGADGYTNTLILHCWKFLRLPLFNYANFCYNSGKLTHNFRSARIRLIPKKGDSSLLKNWRPISLLSNLYKILSRVINTRLNKIVNRICSRSQKGYNQSRYTQEVLINVWETIRYCKENNIKGAVVAIDMAKAFDTLQHDYVNQVYKFFNFGPNIIKWLNLLGCDREACINFGPDINSRFFKLECGRPQGDNVSPNSFNFSVQILIFKIELDPAILPIPREPVPVPVPVPQLNNLFRFESNRETSKNESLADDNSTLTLLRETCILRLKDILTEFGVLSGLKCNFDKTCIMPIQEPSAEDAAWLSRTNFKIVDNITLLGINIVRNLDNVDLIFTKIREKIIQLISYWDRFRLSLPGRITISKTFLVAQLNYTACWLKPSDEMLQSIQSVINNFVKSTLNIAAERLHTPVNLGGLGLLNLTTFFHAQRCAWIARASKLCIDNWRYDLYNSVPGNNLTYLNTIDINRNTNPILYNLAESFECLVTGFSKLNGNYKKANIFNNGAFVNGENQTPNIEFFGREFYRNHKETIRLLKFEDCFQNGRFRSAAGFAELGLPINQATWWRLQLLILHSRQKYKKLDPVCEAKSRDITELFSTYRKGSKLFRQILEHETFSNVDIRNLRVVNTFFQLTGTGNIDDSKLMCCLGSWSKTWLASDIKNFIFRFRNNILHLSNRVHRYDPGVNPNCFFCRMRGQILHESFNHCFWECNTVADMINNFFLEFFPGIGIEDRKTHYWYGFRTEEEPELSQSLQLNIWDFFRFIIFKFKMRHIVPNYNSVKSQSLFLVKTSIIHKRAIREYMSNKPIFANILQALG